MALLFRFLPRRFKGEQILLHKMGIMLQVDGNHNIRPIARVSDTGTGLTTAPSTSQ